MRPREAIVFCALWLSFGLSAGTYLTVGILFVLLSEAYPEQRATAALIGAVFNGAFNMAGPVVNVLCTRLGPRRSLLASVLLGSLGTVLAAFSSSMILVVLCFGVLTGLGMSVQQYVPLMILAQLYPSSHARLTAVLYIGAPVISIVLPFAITSLADSLGWRGMLVCLSALQLQMAVPYMLLPESLHVSQKACKKPAAVPRHPLVRVVVGPTAFMTATLEQTVPKKESKLERKSSGYMQKVEGGVILTSYCKNIEEDYKDEADELFGIPEISGHLRESIKKAFKYPNFYLLNIHNFLSEIALRPFWLYAPEYIKSIGNLTNGSIDDTSLVFMVLHLSTLIGVVPLLASADKLGVYRVFGFIAALSAAPFCNVYFFRSSTAGTVLSAGALTGCCIGMCRPLWTTTFGDLLSKDTQAFGIGTGGLTSGLGGIIGPLLAEWLLGRYPGRYDLVILILAISSLSSVPLMIVATLRRLRQRRSEKTDKTNSGL